jgi:hypothetical protein
MLPVAYLVFDKVMKLTSDDITIMSLPTSSMLSSNRAEISGNVLSLSSETTNITPTGVAGGDISESVISVTTDENIAYASSIRAEHNVDGISLSLPLISALLLDNIAIFSSMVVTVITDSEISLPKTPVEVIFISQNL